MTLLVPFCREHRTASHIDSMLDWYGSWFPDTFWHSQAPHRSPGCCGLRVSSAPTLTEQHLTLLFSIPFSVIYIQIQLQNRILWSKYSDVHSFHHLNSLHKREKSLLKSKQVYTGFLPSLPVALKAWKVLKIKLASNGYRWQCLVLGPAVIFLLKREEGKVRIIRAPAALNLQQKGEPSAESKEVCLMSYISVKEDLRFFFGKKEFSV